MQIMQLYNTVPVPNTNPVWVDLVQSVDLICHNTLIDFMNSLVTQEEQRTLIKIRRRDLRRWTLW
jgi:hypothetical protein